MAQEVKFLDMFGCCAALRDKCGGLELAKVKNVVVSREKRTMDIAAGFAAPGTPADIAMLEWRIAAEYGFARVKITGNTPAAAPAEKKAAPPKKETKPAAKKPESGDVLFGKLPKDNHRTDISELTLQSGTVSVTGKVFAADSRKIQKTNAAVLSFDMTDYTGSIHVSKYIRQGDDQSILDKIRVGDYLTVRGDVIFNRYDNDMAIDVAAIAKETAPQRQDTAEGDKRVELHLHTRYSTLDALTDPTAAVKTAARWGHRAIAVTDHGVAQAFPEFWHAGAKCGIKVIYGVEGYYINDVDDLLAVHGESDLPLNTDFVGFDIETTGLDSHIHRITEIGAVRVENGVVTKSFQTFVDPGMPIPPEIVQLTGITDRDVYGAPGEADARSLGRPAAETLHRPRAGRRAGGAADGRADERARSHFDFEDRGTRHGAQGSLYHRHRYAQYAAGGAYFRSHGVFPARRACGVRRDGKALLPAAGQADGRLHHGEVWLMRSRFDEQLALLNRELIEMGALCEEVIALSAQSLTEGSTELAARVAPLDEEIDRKEREIESLCLKLLLQQQPVAKDLRQISAALKMITDMERIGDQAEDIAEIVTFLGGRGAENSALLREMARSAIKMVTESVDAYVRQNTALAEQVIAEDDVVDDYFTRVKKGLIERIAQDPTDGEFALDLLMIAKYFERIGDHAVNIAEWVIFSVTGEHKEG